MSTRQEDLIEADRRGLLTGEMKTDFDAAVKRGLISLPQTEALGEPIAEQPSDLQIDPETEPFAGDVSPRFPAPGTTGRGAGSFRGQPDPRERTTLTEEIEASGVSTEGAPAGARFVGAFGADDVEATAGIKLGLEQAFGQDVEMRIGPVSKRLEFMNPATKRFTVVNPPGINLTDLASIAPEIGIAALETAGAVVGSGVSPVVGTGAGLFGGAFIGEMSRLRAGQALGINQGMSDETLVIIALQRAGLSAVTGVAVERLIQLGRVFLSGIPAPLFKGTKDEIAGAIKATDQTMAPIEQEISRKVPITVAQTLKDDELATAERVIAKRAGGEQLRDVRTQQQEDLLDFQKSISDPFETPATSQTAGRGVQTAVGRGPRAGVAKVEQQTRQARIASEQATATATRGSIAPPEAGELARETLDTGRDAVQTRFASQYADLNREAGDTVAELTEFATAGRKWKEILDDDILPSLAVEDAPVIADAVSAGVKPASFASVQRTLSTLRAELRRVKKGFSGKDSVALQELHDALLKDRNRALAKRPDLQKMVDDLEASYAEAKTAIDRSMVGELIAKAEGGGFRVRDDKVIPRLLNSPSGAKQVSNVINDPRYGSFAGAKDPIRRGLLGAYQQAVVDPETGIAILARHNAWMARNAVVLKEFFTKAEMSALQKSGTASQLLKVMERRERDVVQSLNKSFGTKMQKYDSSEVVDKVFKPNRLDDLKRTKKLLERDPDKWRDFQGAALRKYWSDVSVYDNAAQAHRIKVSKLADKTDEANSAALDIVFGKEFTKNVKALRNALQVTERQPAGSVQDLADTINAGSQANALRHLARAYVGLFTMKGRIMTAGLRLRGKAAERALVRALSNPRELQRLVELRTAKPFSQKATIILGGLGASILSAPEPSEDELVKPVITIRPPASQGIQE